MDLQLKHRLSLVTGSTAGIGYAIAEALASEGAKVIINGRTQESVDKAIAKLDPKTAGELMGFAGDLSRSETADQIALEYPDVEILINNLGIFEPLPFEEIPDDSLATRPLKIDVTFFCFKCDGMATGRTCPHGEQERLAISGTRLREMFANHETIPPEFSRPEVIAVLQAYYDRIGER